MLKLKVNILLGTDIAVGSVDEHPVEGKGLFQVRLVVDKVLVAGESKKRQLIGVDQVCRMEDAFTDKQPHPMVVSLCRVGEALKLHLDRLKHERTLWPGDDISGTREPATQEVHFLGRSLICDDT